MKKFKALSVDDSEINLYQLEAFAQELPISISNFTNPVKALEKALMEEPDIIFLDYMMPEMNGIEFVKALRKENSKTPVIMITVDNKESVKITALKAGVTDFLLKPLNSAEFIARTSNIINLRISQKELEMKSISLEHEIERATIRIKERERETLMVLAKAAEFKDVETELHTERVAQYSLLLAKKIGLTLKELKSSKFFPKNTKLN